MNKKTLTLFLIALAIVLGVLAWMRFQSAGVTFGKQEDVCPHDNGWNKVEDSDFHEVDGAVMYCWKGGSENSNCQSYLYYSEDPNDYPPEGEHVCGLSHWAYKLEHISPTPTVFDATGTPSATLTPTVELTPTEIPLPSISVTPTEEVTPTRSQPSSTPVPTVSEQKWEEIRTQEGQVFGAQK